MSTWLLNFVKAGTDDKKQLTAQARRLLEVGLWGVPRTSPAKDKLKPGDRLIAYVGAPERVFIGDAVVKRGFHAWTPGEEEARYPMKAMYPAGITLGEAVVWKKPVPLQQVWPQLLAAKKNPQAHFMQTTYPLLPEDGMKLIQLGREGAPPTAVDADPTVSVETPAQSTNPQLARFLAVVEKLRTLPPTAKINEETTRALFLNNYFDALGYSGLADISFGESAQSGNFPDYVLKVAGDPVIAVEAKALGTSLGAKEAGQVTGYCGTLGVRWGLLTDGRFFKLYDSHVTSAKADDRLVFELDLADYRSAEDFEISIWETVQMLAKVRMSTGADLERYAARELTRRLLTDPSSMALEALRTELAKQKVILSAADVRALVRELIGS